MIFWVVLNILNVSIHLRNVLIHLRIVLYTEEKQQNMLSWITSILWSKILQSIEFFIYAYQALTPIHLLSGGSVMKTEKNQNGVKVIVIVRAVRVRIVQILREA